VFAAGIVRAGCGGSLADAVTDGEAAARAVASRLQALAQA
jgi:thioredoxin reductase